jgi:hypothetical protein
VTGVWTESMSNLRRTCDWGEEREDEVVGICRKLEQERRGRELEILGLRKRKK